MLWNIPRILFIFLAILFLTLHFPLNSRVSGDEIERTLYVTGSDGCRVFHSGEIRPDFVFLGGRWSTDSLPIVFMLNRSNSPIPDPVPAIRAAMSAWESACGVKFTLVLNDSAPCGFVYDGINTISFGDCLGQLPPQDPQSCVGVLAACLNFGGIQESDIVFNKVPVGCGWIADPVNLAEVACHELGHSIGLAHSEVDEAIMRWYMHGSGRGARLAFDDQQGCVLPLPVWC